MCSLMRVMLLHGGRPASGTRCCQTNPEIHYMATVICLQHEVLIAFWALDVKTKFNSFSCHLKSVLWKECETFGHVLWFVELCSVILTLSTELKSVNVKTCIAVLGYWGMLNFRILSPNYYEVDYWLLFLPFTSTWILSCAVKPSL